jgi:hypothetical protein
MTMEIKGRDLREGIPRTIVVDDQEIREGPRWKCRFGGAEGRSQSSNGTMIWG